MDLGEPLTQAESNWWRSSFLALSVRTTGNAWEDFVTNAMTALHGGDFVQVDAAGRGDKGCDGFVMRDGLMLASYGASSPNQDYVTAKVRSDFTKARTYWKEHMRLWAFVHNNASGLPDMAVKAVLDLRAEHSSSDVALQPWPPQALWRECLGKLGRIDLAFLLGDVPTSRPANMEYILLCIKALARTHMLEGLEPVHSVPPGKIEHNKLSPETAEMLIGAGAFTGSVRRYFQYATPGESYQVAEELRARYHGHLAALGEPDLVFHAMVEELARDAFANDAPGPLAERRNAALVVVTHFFESCVIFERPGEDDAAAV